MKKVERGGRPRLPLAVSYGERQELESLARSRALAAGLVRRARMILMSIDGLSNTEIARRFRTSVALVSFWRRRYRGQGLVGLHAEARPGRPRTHDHERVAALLRITLESRPRNATHWSVRGLAQATGISKSAVQRYLSHGGVQPPRRPSFKLPKDPLFVERVRDVAGLYLNAPEHVLVLCVDGKSQVQSLERTPPILPAGPGYLEGVTHDHYGHGTTELLAAIDVASGTVLTRCNPRHRHREFLSFLLHLEHQIPEGLEGHLVLDNDATSQHPAVRRWLAQHPRFHLHFTPNYVSWLNQTEHWLSVITRRAIRRGSFGNVQDLVAKIDSLVRGYNREARPFLWTTTADAMLGKNERLHTASNGTQHLKGLP